MNKRFTAGLLIFIVFVVLVGLLARQLLVGLRGEDGFPGRGGRVALVYVEGTITGDSEPSSSILLGPGASSVVTVEMLERARKDSDIRAVVLRVNSPGGSAAASHEVYEEIERVVAEKPLVVSMGDMCASGGYYISSPASYIYASPSTMTGSIGVIWSSYDLSGLLESYGVRSNTLTAGEFKDIGSTARQMKGNERVMLQQMLDQVHDQFIAAVAAGRKLKEEEVRKLATGMIYTGQTAVELKLVDELGGLEAAKAKARELAGLPEDAKVVAYERRRSVFDVFNLLGASFSGNAPVARALEPPSALEIIARRLLLHDIGQLN
ncbi:MAG: hypothetical protein A2Y63_00385 [Candidatus Riflebacteria bacterium RBG_13_59_9]|nr:MAG: hypothetical protein A2Y63_00385 [Candidatus Riflebacteria bacterium RBG_13_59_9]